MSRSGQQKFSPRKSRVSRQTRVAQPSQAKKFKKMVNEIKAYHAKYNINTVAPVGNVSKWLNKADGEIITKNYTQKTLQEAFDISDSMRFFSLMMNRSPKQQKRRQRSSIRQRQRQRQRSRKQRYRSIYDEFS